MRKGLAALLDRRLVARDALNRFLRGKDMSVEMACARLLHALRGAVSPVAGGDLKARSARAFAASGPTSPGFELLALEIEQLMAKPAAAAGAAARRARSAGRPGAHAEGRAAQASRPHQGEVPVAGRLRPAQADRPRPRAAHRVGGRDVPPRHQPRARPRRAPAVCDRAGRISPHARQARRARFSGSARAHAGAARTDGRVLAQPVSARVALRTRAGRRIPGHQPRAVAAGARAGAGVGGGRRHDPRTDAAIDLHRWRPQAVDLRLPRRGGHGARRRGALHRRLAARRPGARGDHPELPVGPRAADVRQRRLCRDRQGARTAGRVSLRRRRCVSRSGGRAERGRGALAWSRPNATRRRPRRWAKRSRGC